VIDDGTGLAPPPRPAPLGTTWKVLIGCALGCGAVLIVGLLGMLGFFAWLARPGELLEPSVLLGPDTTGYAEWTLRMEDPGTRGFVIEALARAEEERAKAQAVPDALMPWLSMFERDTPEEQVARILPLVAAWTLRSGASGEDDLHLFTVSLERMGNQLVFGDWMLGWFLGWAEGVELLEHRGERLYVLADRTGRRTTFFLRGNDVFVSTDPESARSAIDRMEDGGASEADTELARLFASVRSDRPLRAAVSNRRGELRRLWASYAITPPEAIADETWSAIEAVTLAGGLEPDGSLTGTLSFHAAGRVWSQAEVEHLAVSIEDGFAWISQALAVEASPDRTTATLHFRAPDLLGGDADTTAAPHD
jgi:hypothetical protein